MKVTLQFIPNATASVCLNVFPSNVLAQYAKAFKVDKQDVQYIKSNKSKIGNFNYVEINLELENGREISKRGLDKMAQEFCNAASRFPTNRPNFIIGPDAPGLWANARERGLSWPE